MEKHNFIHPSFESQTQGFIDSLLTLFVLLFMFPFLIILWPILLWKIGQPIIFKQKRTGNNDKTFIIYKLRTMVKNAESLRLKNHKQFAKLNYAPEPMFKIGEDPRFIKFGKFLSNSGLDELPQLINVIKGDMSLVGPRPLPIDESKKLQKIDPDWYFWRHQVKPGLFSLWVLNNRRHESLKVWKKLEKETLSLDIKRQYLLIFKIATIQIKNLKF